MKNQLILTLSMLAGIAVAVALALFCGFSSDCEGIASEVFRLHIIANDNSESAQLLKYELRDFLLSDFDDIFASCSSADEAAAAASRSITEVEARSDAFLRRHGFDGGVTAEVCDMYFSTRSYGTFTLPAGNYSALRLVIGDGNGKNWWCVMFPPLCLPACTDYVGEVGKLPELPELSELTELSEKELTELRAQGYFTAEQSRIIEDGGRVEIRFALFEWLMGLFR